MRITPISNQISFKYSSPLKTEWQKGNMPTVTKDIYGSELKPYNVTLEHIIPHSQGGKTELSNLALAVDINNWARGDRPFKNFFSRATFEEYCDQFRKISLPNFDGKRYIEALRETVERVIKNGH